MKKIESCKCSFAQRMVGDGCRYCNPQYYIDILGEQQKETQKDLNTLEAELEKRDGFCEWKLNDYFHEDDYYDTSCGETGCFMEGGIKDNNYKYCPYCGKEIKEITPDPPQEDEG